MRFALCLTFICFFFLSFAQKDAGTLLTKAKDSLRTSSASQFIQESPYFEEVFEITGNPDHSNDSLDILRANYILNLAYAYETKAENYFRAQELYALGKEIHEVQLDTSQFSAWAFAVHHLANIYTRFGDWRRAAFMLRLLRDRRIALDAEANAARQGYAG